MGHLSDLMQHQTQLSVLSFREWTNFEIQFSNFLLIEMLVSAWFKIDCCKMQNTAVISNKKVFKLKYNRINSHKEETILIPNFETL